MLDPIMFAAVVTEQQRVMERAEAYRRVRDVQRSSPPLSRRRRVRPAVSQPAQDDTRITEQDDTRITEDDVRADLAAGRERPLTIPAALGPRRHTLGGSRFVTTRLRTRAALGLGLPAGALVERLWFTPWTVGRNRARPEGARAHDVPWPGGPLSGWQVGHGRTVLVVHGWGGRSTDLAAIASRLAAAGWRVVGVDLPAHGASPGATTDVLVMADAVRAAAEQAGPLDGLVAHSVGAMASLFAIVDGLEVPRAVLIAPVDTMDGAVHRFASRTGLGARGERVLRSRIESRIGPDAWQRLRTTTTAGAVEADVHVIHDVDDLEVPVEDGLAVAAAYGSRPIVTSGLGHGRILTDPDVVSSVAELLDGVERDLPTRDRSVLVPG